MLSKNTVDKNKPNNCGIYFGEQKILLEKVKIVAKPLILQKNVCGTNVFIGAHST
jgi:hypothetical protein